MEQENGCTNLEVIPHVKEEHISDWEFFDQDGDGISKTKYIYDEAEKLNFPTNTEKQANVAVHEDVSKYDNDYSKDHMENHKDLATTSKEPKEQKNLDFLSAEKLYNQMNNERKDIANVQYVFHTNQPEQKDECTNFELMPYIKEKHNSDTDFSDQEEGGGVIESIIEISKTEYIYDEVAKQSCSTNNETNDKGNVADNQYYNDNLEFNTNSGDPYDHNNRHVIDSKDIKLEYACSNLENIPHVKEEHNCGFSDQDGEFEFGSTIKICKSEYIYDYETEEQNVQSNKDSKYSENYVLNEDNSDSDNFKVAAHNDLPKIKHDFKTSSKSDRLSNKSAKYSCPNCSKKFNRSYNLKSHLRTHTGERPYVCSECNKSFSQLSTLRNHYNGFHGKTDEHTCEYCSKTFKSIYNLKSHFMTHSGECPYDCYICEKSFAQQNSLTSHIRRHHSGNLKCRKCSKVYDDYKSFAKHIKTHKDVEKTSD